MSKSNKNTKFGLLINRNCLNLGDDIQSYAESLFLPSIDYLVDREYISEFTPDNPEDKVATIMGAWWTRHKWNMLPPESIVPLWTSIHLSDYTPEQTGTMPSFPDMLNGVLFEHFKAYAPIGTRDLYTLNLLQEYKIPSYFSGCVTLTLPKQKIIPPKKPYILIVDLDSRAESLARDQLKNTGLEIRTLSNIRHKRRTELEMDNWEFRKNETLALLKEYQGATSVITRRLHVALPCLAMEVPVLCVYDPDDSRFDPYYKWLHMTSISDFLEGRYSYDLTSPPPNKSLHLACRDALTKQLTEFVHNAKSNLLQTKTTYSKQNVIEWENTIMKLALNKWQPISIKMAKKIEVLER